MENTQQIDLNQFSGGTGQYYEGFLPGVYTDGIKHVAEECGAYWLINLVLSHRSKLAKKLCLQDFPVTVHLEPGKSGNAKCVVEKCNGERFTLQAIPYTDFPFERFKNNRFSFLLGYCPETRKLILCLAQED